MNDNILKSLSTLVASLDGNKYGPESLRVTDLISLAYPALDAPIIFPQDFRVWLKRNLVSSGRIDPRKTAKIQMQEVNRKLRDSPRSYLGKFNEWKALSEQGGEPAAEAMADPVSAPFRSNMDYGDRQLNLFNREKK